MRERRVTGESNMADGKWVMTEDDARRVDLTFNGAGIQYIRDLPNYGKHMYIDNRNGNAEERCAFCSSDDLQSGFGGCGEGFGYRSFKCKVCGGTTDFVYKDDIGKYIR